MFYFIVYWFEKVRQRDIDLSLHLVTHSLACAVTEDRTRNLGGSGWRAQRLTDPARAGASEGVESTFSRVYFHTTQKYKHSFGTHHGRGETPHFHVIYPYSCYFFIRRLFLYCTIAYISWRRESIYILEQNLDFFSYNFFKNSVVYPCPKLKNTHLLNTNLNEAQE